MRIAIFLSMGCMPYVFWGIYPNTLANLIYPTTLNCSFPCKQIALKNPADSAIS